MDPCQSFFSLGHRGHLDLVLIMVLSALRPSASNLGSFISRYLCLQYIYGLLSLAWYPVQVLCLEKCSPLNDRRLYFNTFGKLSWPFQVGSAPTCLTLNRFLSYNYNLTLLSYLLLKPQRLAVNRSETLSIACVKRRKLSMVELVNRRWKLLSEEKTNSTNNWGEYISQFCSLSKAREMGRYFET